MALVLTRKDGEAIHLSLPSDITENELQTLISGGIRVTLYRDSSDHTKLAVEAPRCVEITRTELLTS